MAPPARTATHPEVICRRIFLDTEWTARPWSDQLTLMWIGLADDEGRSWSAISAGADIDDVPGVWKYISPGDPRSTSGGIAAGAIAFCGDIDEFWPWIRTLEEFAAWFDVSDDAPGPALPRVGSVATWWMPRPQG